MVKKVTKRAVTKSSKAKAVFSNKWSRLIAVPLICLIVAFGASFGLRALTEQSLQDTSSTQTNCDGICVDLRSTAATPDSISVPIGSFVQFNSADGETYNLSLGSGSEHGSVHGAAADSAKSVEKAAFTSGDFGEGEAWRVQFKQKGTFEFYDRYNPDLSVLVVAYEPGAEYKVE